jgi:hypothetical protein
MLLIAVSDLLALFTFNSTHITFTLSSDCRLFDLNSMEHLKSADIPRSVTDGPNATESKVFGTQDYTRLFENDFTFQHRGFSRPIELYGYRSPRPFDSDDEKVPDRNITPKQSSSMMNNTPSSSGRRRRSSPHSSGGRHHSSRPTDQLPSTDKLSDNVNLTSSAVNLPDKIESPIASSSVKKPTDPTQPSVAKLAPLTSSTVMDPELYRQFVSMVGDRLELPNSPEEFIKHLLTSTTVN